MKTLADLKRDAKSGTLEGRFTYHSMWPEGLPERLQGWRKLIDSNSVAIVFLNEDGKKSELQIKKAALVEYDGETLTVYNAGYRDLTTDEQRVLDAWAKIAEKDDYKENARIDALTDGSSTYYQKLRFFKDAGYEYLIGLEEQRGMKYDWNTEKVRDDKVKGSVCMRYELRKAA